MFINCGLRTIACSICPLCTEQPDPPENVTITNSTDRKQVITWDNAFNGNLNITDYKIYTSTLRVPELTLIYPSGRKREAVVQISGTRAEITSLIPFVRYSYTVVACNSFGCSNMSDLSNTIQTDPAGEWSRCLV